MEENKQYYSVQEIADIFRLSYSCILAAIKKGRVKAFKVSSGRRCPYRIPAHEITRVQEFGMEEIFKNED